MRTPDNENKLKEYEIGKKIKEMWGRIDEAAYAQNTSVGAIAKAEGISAAAMYSAIRKTRKTGEYTDTLLSCITALAHGLHLDLDYVLTGLDSSKEACTIASIIEGLSDEDLKILKRVSIGMALGVVDGI